MKQMVSSAFLKLKAKKIGEIKGSVIQYGRDGTIELISVNHQFISSRDAVTGQATTRRIHQPISFIKEIDKTTPVFNQMLAQNIEIDEARFSFYDSLPHRSIGYAAGQERMIYSIIIKKAFVTRVELTLHNVKQQEEKPGFVESISLQYEQIEWIWADGNISAKDEQRTQV